MAFMEIILIPFPDLTLSRRSDSFRLLFDRVPIGLVTVLSDPRTTTRWMDRRQGRLLLSSRTSSDLEFCNLDKVDSISFWLTHDVHCLDTNYMDWCRGFCAANLDSTLYHGPLRVCDYRLVFQYLRRNGCVIFK